MWLRKTNFFVKNKRDNNNNNNNNDNNNNKEHQYTRYFSEQTVFYEK